MLLPFTLTIGRRLILSMMISKVRGRLWIEYSLVAGLSSLLALAAMPWLGSPSRGFMEDDSWFYSQIAFLWPRVGFPTFDGLHQTSGFHLFWGGLLAGVSWIVSLWTSSKLVLASVLTALHVTILWASARLIARSALHRKTLLVVAMTILSLGAFYMETAPLGLLLLVLLHRSRSLGHQADRSAAITLTLLAAAAGLCRVDALLILFVWGISAFHQRVSRPLLLGATLGLVLHGGAMFLVFGQFYSVSSMLKLSAALQASHGFPLPKMGILVRLVVWLFVSTWAFSRARAVGRVTVGALLGTSAFTLLHLLVSDMRSWYFLPGYAVALFVSAAPGPGTESVTDGLRSEVFGPRGQMHFLRLALALSLALLAYRAVRFVGGTRERALAWEFVAGVRDTVPTGESIYEIDATGFPGFWSERPIINGDGLVNSYDYARRLQRDQLHGYLLEEGTCWLITTSRMMPKDPQRLIDYHGLVVSTSQATPVFPGKGGRPRRRTQLWRLNSQTCKTGH